MVQLFLFLLHWSKDLKYIQIRYYLHYIQKRRQLCCKIIFKNSILKIVCFRKNEGFQITFEDNYIFSISKIERKLHRKLQRKLNIMVLLSWAKDMNIYHSFCESLYKRTIRAEKLRYFCLFFYIFVSHNPLYLYKNLW